VSYTQCTQTDHSVLLTLTEPTDEFIESLTRKSQQQSKHNFIAKVWEKHVTITDFAKNYTSLVQDQCFHWHNTWLFCTLSYVLYGGR
jgi:hypothetical protein